MRTQSIARGTDMRAACARAGRARTTLALTALLTACGGSPADGEIEVGATGRTSEAGDSFAIELKLERRPLGVVTLYAISSDPSEGVVSQAVQFDESDWQRPQALIISGVDDDLQDGDSAYHVSFYERSSRLRNKPLLLGSIEVVNYDDESVAEPTEPEGRL